MNRTSKVLRAWMLSAAMMQLAACGGGGSQSVTTYEASATAGNGGTVSPAAATVDAGGSARFTVTPNAGYVISGVTGCGGSLAGNTYTTGAINAGCTVTASFSAAFTWISGSNTTGASGVYGSQGVAAAANVPGSRDGGATWTDANGNLWLFGGFAGYPNAANPATGNFMNDLWEYSPSSGEWTWVSGSSTAGATGVYGTQGVAAATNVPGARDSEAVWLDTSGNLWLFGGEGYLASTGYYHRFNDLWKFSPTSGQWTWVAGSNTFDATGVYGTRGVAAAANVPGARATMATWQDASGNAWIFDGYQYDDPTNIRFEMNDLWKYPTR